MLSGLVAQLALRHFHGSVARHVPHHWVYSSAG